jgi:hypothetical protein
MSQLTEIANPPRTDAIPGLTLTAPGIEELAMAERYCEEAYLATVAGGAASMTPAAAAAAMAAARAEVRAGEIGYGTHAFDAWANRLTSAPLLTLLCARRHHPKLTYPAICKLYDDAMASGDDKKYRRAVLELFGYSFEAKKKDVGSAEGMKSESPSSGEASSIGSALPPPSDSGSAPTSSSV